MSLTAEAPAVIPFFLFVADSHRLLVIDQTLGMAKCTRPDRPFPATDFSLSTLTRQQRRNPYLLEFLLKNYLLMVVFNLAVVAAVLLLSKSPNQRLSKACG